MNKRICRVFAGAAMLWLLNFLILSSWAQEAPVALEDGFPLLEQGDYVKAKDHFEQYLAYEPNNKTAQICYGRALGLGGEPRVALGHFQQMEQSFPHDLEVSLNLAEAYLWNSKFLKAKALYEQLLNGYPDNFAANLGYANSLSNLKQYPQAYKVIQTTRALDSNNPSAKISQKYICLGYASDLAFKQYRYDSAFKYLDEVLLLYENDHEANMLKANIYNSIGAYDQAQSLLNGLEKQKVYVYMGQSVSAHMLKKDRKALVWAQKAYDLSLTPPDTIYWKAAVQNLISANLWNKKFKESEQHLSLLKTKYPDDPEVMLTEAQFYMYQADIDNAIPLIEEHLSKNEQSFPGNLSLADANHALGLDKAAYQWGMTTLDYHPGHPEARKFLNKLNSKHAPYVDAEMVYQEDSDNSYTLTSGLRGKASLSPQLSISVHYQQAVAGKQELDDDTKSQYIQFNARTQLNKIAALNLQLGRVKIDLPEQLDYAGTIGQLSTELRLNKLQKLEVGAKRELQNFNQALLEQRIFMNHIFARHNMYWPKSGWGWYTEAFKTWQSDENQRNLIFTSIYKNLLDRPKVKTGLNLLHLGFRDQFPELYYSPQAVTSLEGFVEVIQGNLTDENWELSALFATGYQFGDDKQPILRVQASATRKLGERFKLKLFGQYSTITAVVSNGFSFYQAGINLSYKLNSSPLFRQNTD